MAGFGGIRTLTELHVLKTCRASTVAVLLLSFMMSRTFAMTGTQADALADHLLGKIAMSKGVCAVLDCGDGTFALALTQKSGFVVHAGGSDAAGVESAVTRAETAGLLGRSFYAERGTLDRLPFAANFVDLIVLVSASGTTISRVAGAEILRVLRPGGVAILGRATVETSGSLSVADLNGWVSSAGITGAAVESDAQGVWAQFSKPIPAGMDEWTHRSHGPDNNPYSPDQLIDISLLPQYFSQPHNANWGHLTVAGGGRIYTAYRKYHGWVRGLGLSMRVLAARRVYNGELLWMRNLSQEDVHWPTDYSIMNADQDYLYLAKDAKVLVLDGETGTETRVIEPAEVTGEIKWMGRVGRTLHMLSGTPDAWDGPSSEINQKRLDGRIGFGTRFTAYSISSNSVVWSHEAGGIVDNREVGVSNGKLFYYARGVELVCLDAGSGALQWRLTRQSLLDSLDAHLGLMPGQFGIMSEISGFLCSPEALVICSIEDSSIISLSTTNGDVLWSIPRKGGRGQHKVVVDSMLFNTSVDMFWGSPDKGKHCAMHIVTGEPLRDIMGSVRSHGCGPFSACPAGLATQNGAFCFDFATSEYLGGPRLYKGPCAQGNLITNGLIMTPAQACQCPPKYRGNAAGAPAGDFVFDQSAVQSERLETGPQGTGNVIAVAQDAADWATHRGNLERTASASVSVPSDVNKIAHFTPAALYVSPNMSYDFEGTAVEFRNPDEPEYLPTPPVIVGAYVFWGGADGMVRCYDLAAQEQVWSAPTGGCIFATPTVSEGRVYVGSGDGWAYCFEATTGRLLWRFRGAPTDRRIMYYGHLIGTWPTNTGVLVENGVAYLGNGLVERMGSHFYALDAATGTIKWQNNRTGIAYDADGREGHIPAGYLSLRDGTLWARCYTGPDAAFDIADGSLRQSPLRDDWPWYTSGGKNRSYDIGFVGDRFIYTGGRPREWDHCQRGSSRGDYFILQEIDATGKRLYPTIVLRENSCLAPAWDSAAIVLADDEATRLECWDMTKFVAYAAQLRSDSAAAYGAGRSSKSHTIRNPAIPYDGLRLWNDTTLDMNAVVLSSNAVVITHRTRPDRDSPWTWRLSVRDKTTGAAIWEQVLPSEPVHGGLALARNGDVVVTLCSGEMLCYGTGTPVSVATSATVPPSTSSPAIAAEVTVSGFGEQVGRRPESVQASLKADDSAVRNARAPSTDNSDGTQAQLVVHLPPESELKEEPPIEEVPPECESLEWRLDTEEQIARARYEPKDMHWYPERTCLPIVDVNVSSADSLHEAANVTDRDLRTRWQPGRVNDDEWLVVDLGSVCHVSGISLVWYIWESGEGTIEVETSIDGEAFRSCDRMTSVKRGMQQALRTFLPAPARYLRVRSTSGESPLAFSILEVGVHGEARGLAAREQE